MAGLIKARAFACYIFIKQKHSYLFPSSLYYTNVTYLCGGKEYKTDEELPKEGDI